MVPFVFKITLLLCTKTKIYNINQVACKVDLT